MHALSSRRLICVAVLLVLATPAAAQWRACVPEGPRVALTFDDGPWADFTSEVLEVLANYQAPATFFVVGQRVNAQPQMLLRVVEEGHEVGLHGYSHVELTKVGPERRQSEIDRTWAAIQRAAPGVDVRWWRAPYGSVPNSLPSALNLLGLRHQGWSVDSLDWRHPSEHTFFSNVLGPMHSGAVVLMHEHTVATRAHLFLLLQTLAQQGYQFVRVSELHAPTCPAGETPPTDGAPVSTELLPQPDLPWLDPPLPPAPGPFVPADPEDVHETEEWTTPADQEVTWNEPTK